MRRLGRSAGLLLLVWVGAGQARAGEPKVAIAPIALGSTTAPELQRAFQEELPRALLAAGFAVLPPNEVDMRVAERPELLRCAAGGCLAEEAAFLRVARLVLPRLEVTADKEGGLTVGLSLYDAAQKQPVCEAVARCPACNAERLRATVHAAALELHQSSVKPGTLEVDCEPSAQLTVDDRAMGGTPWSGELAPGDHLVVLQSGGARVQRDVSVAPGRASRVSIKLDAVVPQRAVPRTRFRVAKWVLFAGGLALAAAGAGVWAIDGRGTCSLRPMQVECPKLYNTVGAGATLVGVGGAFLVTSFIMLGVDKPIERPALTAEVRF